MIPGGKNSYRTNPDRPRSIFSKIFLRPKATFYLQVFWIIWKNSRKALKGRYPAEKWAESSFEIIRALENIGASIDISGLENLKNFDGPAVFISNHMSTLETLVLPSIIQPLKPVTFVVKESLVKMPVFGPIMRARDPILVGRTNAREDLRAVLEEGTKKLRNGQSIVVFPQSTRSFIFNPEEFNSLGIKLALKANVPVVPIALKTDAWGIGKKIKDFGPIDIRKKIYFAFGERMIIQNRGADEHQKIIQFITEHLKTWNKE
ncbi:MAG: 1-acyl-sn-glycerol-3-phosphate acyltransferase [Nitrospirae bacterium]|nr:1-acyl-sn-glycerol-3-phosphate acyltransferase [Nitrospirota bacterium]